MKSTYAIPSRHVQPAFGVSSTFFQQRYNVATLHFGEINVREERIAQPVCRVEDRREYTQYGSVRRELWRLNAFRTDVAIHNAVRAPHKLLPLLGK